MPAPPSPPHARCPSGKKSPLAPQSSPSSSSEGLCKQATLPARNPLKRREGGENNKSLSCLWGQGGRLEDVTGLGRPEGLGRGGRGRHGALDALPGVSHLLSAMTARARDPGSCS